jgi:hypothetical protein
MNRLSADAMMHRSPEAFGAKIVTLHHVRQGRAHVLSSPINGGLGGPDGMACSSGQADQAFFTRTAFMPRGPRSTS